MAAATEALDAYERYRFEAPRTNDEVERSEEATSGIRGYPVVSQPLASDSQNEQV